MAASKAIRGLLDVAQCSPSFSSLFKMCSGNVTPAQSAKMLPPSSGLIRKLKLFLCRRSFLKLLIIALAMLSLLSAKSKISRDYRTSDNFTNPMPADPQRIFSGRKKELCPTVPPNLVGRVNISLTVPSMEEIEKAHPELEPGGQFHPAECRSRHRVAIIIPYRDRAQHLPALLHHITPILQRQQIEYTIYVVEQAGNDSFNRGKLMNVGALESLMRYSYDCFIFHDVDLLPEDDRNLYTCPEQPRHMSVVVNASNFQLLFNGSFGGVSAIAVQHFRTINGYNNRFWGWGGEDDDMSSRLEFHGLKVTSYNESIARYTMLQHPKAVPNPDRFKIMAEGKSIFKTEGLNNIQYKVLEVKLQRMYTWILADLKPS
ncbi:beta-1,4-N-acetylgalactosaminyltransferase bre-4-like [Macrobrachium nipponense]|uniref:beta-1,4-N-acetylgalactosaminyltransferase bre-4-like n=1 Tax=Macrobrachium nipponense TaxID=159736 RepID=UPI0030C8D2B4